MAETLFIAKNSKTVGWCLKRLQRTMKRDKHHVCLLQNPAIYYAGSFARKGHNILKNSRGEELEKCMEEVVAEGWIRYLVDEHGFNPPAWLTLDLLGSVTISGNGDKAFFGQKQEVPNTDTPGRRRRKSPGRRRFEEMRRSIRAEWTPVITKHLLRMKEEEHLRPDVDLEEAMHAVHKDMWRLTSRSSRSSMKTSEYERRCGQGEELELVRESAKSEPLRDVEPNAFLGDNPGYTPDSESDPESDVGSNDGDAAEKANGKPASACEPHVPEHVNESPPSATPTPDVVIDPGVSEGVAASPDVNPTNANPTAEAMTSGAGNDKDVQVWLPMPDNWLHPYSLVIAIFSNLADEPFPSSKLSSNNGRKAESEQVLGVGGAASAVAGTATGDAVGGDPVGGDADSGDDGFGGCAASSAGATESVAAGDRFPNRTKPAEIRHTENSKACLRTKALRMIEEGRKDLKTGEQMASSVAIMMQVMMEDLTEKRQAKREERAVRKREREANELREVIKLYEELGERSEAIAKKRQLIRLLSAPPALETLAAGAGSRAAAAVGQGASPGGERTTGAQPATGGKSGPLRVGNEMESDVVVVNGNGAAAAAAAAEGNSGWWTRKCLQQMRPGMVAVASQE